MALERWPADGVTGNPGAWITTTARRKAIDRLRREKVRLRKQEKLEALADYHLLHAARDAAERAFLRRRLEQMGAAGQ